MCCWDRLVTKMLDVYAWIVSARLSVPANTDVPQLVQNLQRLVVSPASKAQLSCSDTPGRCLEVRGQPPHAQVSTSTCTLHGNF